MVLWKARRSRVGGGQTISGMKSTPGGAAGLGLSGCSPSDRCFFLRIPVVFIVCCLLSAVRYRELTFVLESVKELVKCVYFSD